jgi:hypothetical protein
MNFPDGLSGIVGYGLMTHKPARQLKNRVQDQSDPLHRIACIDPSFVNTMCDKTHIHPFKVSVD